MGEEGEPQGIIGPIPAVLVLIEAAVTPEKRGRIDQPDRQIGVRKLARDKGGVRDSEHGIEFGNDARVLDAHIGPRVGGEQ